MDKDITIGAIAHFKPYDYPISESQWGFICGIDNYERTPNIPTQYAYAVYVQSFNNSEGLRYMFFSSERGAKWDIVE
jgi:hypothetical protein